MIRDFHENSLIVCPNLFMYSLTVWCDKGPIHTGLSPWVDEGGCIESSGLWNKSSDDEAIRELNIT